MEGADCSSVLWRSLANPLREALMERRALGLRHARVSDVTDQDVMEAERTVAGNRRALFAHDELALEQQPEQLVDVELGLEPLQRSLPEHAADDRGRPQDTSRLVCKEVDPCSDQRLDRAGDAARTVLGAVALEQHPRRLFEEQRIAFRLHENPLADLRRRVLRHEQLVHELPAFLRRERIELDRRCA